MPAAGMASSLRRRTPTAGAAATAAIPIASARRPSRTISGIPRSGRPMPTTLTRATTRAPASPRRRDRAPPVRTALPGLRPASRSGVDEQDHEHRVRDLPREHVPLRDEDLSAREHGGASQDRANAPDLRSRLAAFGRAACALAPVARGRIRVVGPRRAAGAHGVGRPPQEPSVGVQRRQAGRPARSCRTCSTLSSQPSIDARVSDPTVRCLAGATRRHPQQSTFRCTTPGHTPFSCHFRSEAIEAAVQAGSIPGSLGAAGDAVSAPSVPRVSVVIPTINEAQNLPHVFAGLPPGLFEVIVVDGHSTDGTTEVAEQLRADVRIVLEGRRGKGSALARGFAEARGDIIVTLDADGSADPGEIPRFVDALLDGADFAKGSRNLRGSRQRRPHAHPRYGQPLSRLVRERPLRHALHRPLLRLQRVLARRARRDTRRLRRASRSRR